jgi:hypothetical protein
MPAHPTTSDNEADTAPVACALSLADLATQASRWRQLIARTMTERTETPDGVRLCFRDDPGVQGELHQLAGVESQCCAWATWTVRKAAHEVRSTGTGISTLHTMFTGLEGHQVSQELLDPVADLITDGPYCVETETSGVGEVPVEVPLAGEDRAGVAAAHGDDDVGGLDLAGGKGLGEFP